MASDVWVLESGQELCASEDLNFIVEGGDEIQRCEPESLPA